MNVDYIDHVGSDLTVVNAARVSFNKESDWEREFVSELNEDGYLSWDKPVGLCERDEKLIKYLAKHEHFSPFNHTFITVRVKAPIFVARQLVKHEYMPWNEISRRYVDEEPEFYLPEVWRGRADNVKQGSSDEHPEWFGDGDVEDIKHFLNGAAKLYEYLIDTCGVCPEQARMILPQNTYTEWYWSGTLKAFAKMYNLRSDSHTQRETQEIAQKVDEIIRPLFPVSWSALVDE